MMKNPESATVHIRYERGKSNMNLVLLGTSHGVSEKERRSVSTAPAVLPVPDGTNCCGTSRISRSLNSTNGICDAEKPDTV